MPEPIKFLDPEGHDRVAKIIAGSREALVAAGFPAGDDRFPFLRHHAAVRALVRGGFEGRRSLRHSEIAGLLAEWSTAHGGAEPYAWQAISMAIQSMAAENPGLRDRIPQPILNSAVRNLPKEDRFIDYAQERVGTARRKKAK